MTKKENKGFWGTMGEVLKEEFESPPPSYEVEVICLNCGNTDTMSHICGKVLPQKKLDSKKCDECECKKVFRRNFVQPDDTDDGSANGAVVAAGAAAVICAGR